MHSAVCTTEFVTDELKGGSKVPKVWESGWGSLLRVFWQTPAFLERIAKNRDTLRRWDKEHSGKGSDYRI